MRAITVLGAEGWIGSSLVKALNRTGRDVLPVKRGELNEWLARDNSLGPVIYTIGLTADFRERPHATTEAHVTLLSKVIQRDGLSQLLMLSSTRVYSRSQSTDEAAALPCLSSDPSDYYNLSKLMGEALVLQDPRPGFKVARISNVVGAGQPDNTFIGSLLKDARNVGEVIIRQPASMVKDYVELTDVIRLLPLISTKGKQRLYNLGSGFNTSHAQVAAWLESQGVKVRFEQKTKSELRFPLLSIKRLSAEFDPPGSPFLQNLI